MTVREPWPGRRGAGSVNSLPYDNLRPVNSRANPPGRATVSLRRLLPWLLVLAVIAAGVALAFRFGPGVTPLIDTVR